MKYADFVHLHNHSDYSLLDGASPIPGMLKRAAELHMPALALTDHGALFGAVEFYQEALKTGVKPIVGMEAYVTRGKRQDRTRDTAHHLVLLARDERGFRNLMRLSSLAFLEGFYYKPRVDHEILSQHSEGLLALSACPKGEVATDLMEDNEEGAYRTAMMYRDLFGADNYFLEIQNHGLEIEDKIRERMRGLASRTGIPLVATNDCHYLRHEDADAHDVLLCIQTGKSVEDGNRLRYQTDQVYFKSADEMKARFADFPEAIKNTLAIAERCNLQLTFGKPLLPAFPLPPGAESPEQHLCALARAELTGRFAEPSEAIRQRFEYELDVICRMGFASYFLIVRDFIAFARSRGIGVGPGRGSVAGSLVAYVLRITDIDPIQHGLIFERFLNPERVTMPDIDIDFDDLRRGEVIQYVKEKYGEANVTQIITFGTMGAKGVVRDVGRALGLAFAEVDRLAKLVPDGLGMTLERALELSPELKALPSRSVQHERLLRTARTLEGLARHASTHAAGVLITPGPLLDYVPLYRQKDESVTTQWDMKAVEKAGLLKMDFLGLRTLSVLEESVRLIEKRNGQKIDLPTIPMDDAAAYKIFQDADTVAIFQFESTGMRDYLKRLKPTVFEDLVAMNALYRPGPMENIPYFVDCKHSRQVARYEHPDLEPILKGTYGVFVYQEQVMQAAHALAGFSLAQADELRRAMGKKLAHEMEAKRKAFIEGCAKKKIPAAKAEKIFQTMEKFAGYGFNKCLAGATKIMDAQTGECTTIESLFRERRPFVVHSLDDGLKLRPRRVKDVVWNGRKRVYELHTELGHTITATRNHPFRVLSGWKTLGELKPGDRIAGPREMKVPSRRAWPRHELIALAGLLSEGNTCHPTSLYFYNSDREFIDDFAEAISCFPDTVARIHTRQSGKMEVCANLGRHYVREGIDEAYAAVEGNLALVMDAPGRRSGAFRWAERLGILDKKATEKRVPAEVFMLRDVDLRLLLGRLWSGDGFFASESLNVPFYATSSKGLAVDVQNLLLRLGILSRIHTKQFKYRNGLRPGYAVSLLGEKSVDAFLDQVAPHVIGRRKAIALLRAHLGRTQRGRTSKDTVPREVRHWVNEERLRLGMTWDELEQGSGVSIRSFASPSRLTRGYRRATVNRLAKFFGSIRLKQVANSEVFWDRVVSIEPKGIEDTYDLTVEGEHNFVANGLIVHNSHSAAYALLAYQCAYLKAHYPAEFMAATLTSEMSDSTRIVTLIDETRRLGIELLPPDVNASDWKFSLEDGRIRFGLGAVRNVGAAVVETLVAARAQGGPFRDLFDLAHRLEGRALNRRVLESLVAAGACDALGGERAAMHEASERVLQQAASLHRERESGQSTLFGAEPGGGVAIVAPPIPPATTPWTRRDRSAKEKEVLGFYFSEHPLEQHRMQIERVSTHCVAQILAQEDGADVRVAGIMAEKRMLTTRSGKRMAIVTLEDLTGRIECTVFPDLFESSNALLETDRIVVVSGRLEVNEERGTKLLLSEVISWEDALGKFRAVLQLRLPVEDLSVERLKEIDGVLSRHEGDAEVHVYLVSPNHSVQALRSRRYRVAEGPGVLEALRNDCPWLRARWSKGGA